MLASATRFSDDNFDDQEQAATSSRSKVRASTKKRPRTRNAKKVTLTPATAPMGERQAVTCDDWPVDITGAPLPYRPETRTWDAYPRQIGPGTFEVREWHGSGLTGKKGVRVATITVEPGIDQESARTIACLMLHAPELWRALRDENRWNLVRDTEILETFQKLTALLWAAADRPPYARAGDSEDEEVFRRQGERASAALSQRRPELTPR